MHKIKTNKYSDFLDALEHLQKQMQKDLTFLKLEHQEVKESTYDVFMQIEKLTAQNKRDEENLECWKGLNCFKFTIKDIFSLIRAQRASSVVKLNMIVKFWLFLKDLFYSIAIYFKEIFISFMECKTLKKSFQYEYNTKEDLQERLDENKKRLVDLKREGNLSDRKLTKLEADKVLLDTKLALLQKNI